MFSVKARALARACIKNTTPRCRQDLHEEFVNEFWGITVPFTVGAGQTCQCMEDYCNNNLWYTIMKAGNHESTVDDVSTQHTTIQNIIPTANVSSFETTQGNTILTKSTPMLDTELTTIAHFENILIESSTDESVNCASDRNVHIVLKVILAFNVYYASSSIKSCIADTLP